MLLFYVDYKGSLLLSDTKILAGKVWDNKGKASSWSARWFSNRTVSNNRMDCKVDRTRNRIGKMKCSFYSRRILTSEKKIKSATAYIITAHGIYEAFLNGKRIGDLWLAQGWTSYNKRLQYQAYDVTELLQNGQNHHWRNSG